MAAALFTVALGKAQWIRLADVFLVGPLMIWGGYHLTGRSRLGGAALAGLGVATIVFNGRNYLLTREAGPENEQ